MFFDPSDYALYRDLLAERRRKASVEVWAHCLMPNHVHLVLTTKMPDGLARGIDPVAGSKEDSVKVRTMTADDEARAVDTIVLAFAGDPMTRWVWPQSHQYLAAMPRFARAFGGAAFSQGGALCSDDYAGAALWLPPGVHPDEERMGELMESTASPAAQEAGAAIFEQMAKYHPEEPHWYLPLIGVDPAQQGRGHGDALMRYALERFDREKLPAYLESTNPRNISLYRRHGFEELGTIQAGSSPRLVPMLRRPR